MACPFRSNRKHLDIAELVRHKYNVSIVKDDEIYVEFSGPDETPYAGGKWRVSVLMSDRYPIEKPILRFIDSILHPNICKNSGHVCMNVVNRDWDPKCTLRIIFDYYLGELLRQPNFAEPMFYLPVHYMIPELLEKAVIRLVKKQPKSNDDDILESLREMFSTD